MINNESETSKAVLRYEIKKDDKGMDNLKPVYLHVTPKEVIQAMNEEHQDWKTTKQVKYDKDGYRIEE